MTKKNLADSPLNPKTSGIFQNNHEIHPSDNKLLDHVNKKQNLLIKKQQKLRSFP